MSAAPPSYHTSAGSGAAVFPPVDEFMEKPVESKALVKKVAELLDRR